ncbi:arginine/serine-rich coiled-coil protein 2 isoform X2 [Bombyx mandarina]|uniref:Arginine/serine-rich coiled-coil protein 2 isoform X2 n=1 Tax=Bombyx mandarina TaxID=7092 RepID=A0A6J2JHJ2_BOMMA|nr:arginine/serine-rich coiled-coil protein 2 isoform X2 [Bombyx mandarina]
MYSLVGYGSDDDVESERSAPQQSTVAAGSRRREDDTNYDDVNMDMSEDSQAGESEPELPPVEPRSSTNSKREERHSSNESRERARSRDKDRERGRDRDRERARRDGRGERGRDRSERDRRRSRDSLSRRGLLGDKPDDSKVPALMDLKPFGGTSPPGHDLKRSHDARDAASPRFVDRDRRDKDRERERERERDRHSRRSEEKRSSSARHPERRERSRSRGPASSHAPSNSSSERRESVSIPPPNEFRSTSYKVNKKLEVMEKMGLQIKRPDGTMATARELRAGLPADTQASRVLDQVQKRKLLWANKSKADTAEATKWTGTRFAQDADGKQVSKFMRLMGIKEPAAAPPPAAPSKEVDPIKKQEELFQAMQAQYEVARATTHTMRGVGLGFQRGQF